jgi:hypothetical protein
MTKNRKEGVKKIALKLYRDSRISLEMAIWAMKNAGYTKEETEEWLEIKDTDRSEVMIA